MAGYVTKGDCAGEVCAQRIALCQGFGLKEWAARDAKPIGESDIPESEAPDSGKLSGAPMVNGHAVAE